jgi:PIN domain nuclease of toxin-antitoxin system
VTTLILDSHVVHWWSAEPDRLSSAAAKALDAADELAVASISWFELAWLAEHERILVTIPIRSWLEGLADQMRTFGTTPAIAAVAVSLPTSFPGDLADRLIFATAIEHGVQLVNQRCGASVSAVDHHLGNRAGDGNRGQNGAALSLDTTVRTSGVKQAK